MNKPFITVLFLVATLAIGFGFILPQYQTLKSLQADIQEKNAEFHSKTEYFSQIKEIAEKLSQYEEGLSKISSALPSAPSLPSLFNFLQRTSSQTGLILEEITLKSISAPQETEGLKEISVELQLIGSYSALKDFLLAVETSAGLIEVEKISFSTPRDLEQPFSFKVEIKSHSY